MTTQALPQARSFPKFWDVRDWRMGQKLLGAFLAAVILPVAITGFGTLTSSRDALLAQGNLSLESIGTERSTAIDNYLRASREDVVVASNLPETIAYASNPNDATAKANTIKALTAIAGKKDYDSVAIVNKQGSIIYSTNALDIREDVSSRDYFQPALRGQVYISDPAMDLITKRPSIYFTAPIFDTSGSTVGVIRSRLTLLGIWELVEGDLGAAGTGSFGMLLDESGMRLAHSISKGNRTTVEDTLLFRPIAPLPDATVQGLVADNRLGTATERATQVLPLPEVAAALKDPREQVFESSADNSTMRHQATIARLGTKPWFYVVMAPIPTFTGPTDALALRLFVITLIVAVLASLGALFLARGFTQPIVQLTQVADRISLGELDAKIDINRKDEIGELAEAVRRMQASLQAAIERLRARRAGS